jgi:hypothetical protein
MLCCACFFVSIYKANLAKRSMDTREILSDTILQLDKRPRGISHNNLRSSFQHTLHTAAHSTSTHILYYTKTRRCDSSFYTCVGSREQQAEMRGAAYISYAGAARGAIILLTRLYPEQ